MHAITVGALVLRNSQFAIRTRETWSQRIAHCESQRTPEAAA